MDTCYIEEMSETIAEHCNANRDDILRVLAEYWSDKIAHVWQVDDVIDAAVRRGLHITAQDASDILQDIHDHIDCEYGITWTTIEVALDDCDGLPCRAGENTDDGHLEAQFEERICGDVD